MSFGPPDASLWRVSYTPLLASNPQTLPFSFSFPLLASRLCALKCIYVLRHERSQPIQLKVFEQRELLSFMEKNEQDKDTPRTCGHCRRDLSMGDDVLVLYRAVLGPTMAVPLETKRLFHCNGCFQEYVCNSDGPKMPKRIP